MRLATALFALALFAPALGAQTPDDPPGLDPSAMDLRVDPCVDFYAYACGGWVSKNPIPPDKAEWGVTEQLQEKIRVRLKGILEVAATPQAKRTDVEQRIGDYYTACMDEGTIESRGKTPFDALAAQIQSISSLEDLGTFLASSEPATPLDEVPTYPLSLIHI